MKWYETGITQPFRTFLLCRVEIRALNIVGIPWPRGGAKRRKRENEFLYLCRWNGDDDDTRRTTILRKNLRNAREECEVRESSAMNVVL